MNLKRNKNFLLVHNQEANMKKGIEEVKMGYMGWKLDSGRRSEHE